MTNAEAVTYATASCVKFPWSDEQKYAEVDAMGNRIRRLAEKSQQRGACDRGMYDEESQKDLDTITGMHNI